MQLTQSLQRFSIERSLQDELEHGLLRTLRYHSLRLALHLVLFLLWMNQWLGIFSQEMGSLFERISVRNKGPHFVEAGPRCEKLPIQRLVSCTRTLSRSACISKIVSNHPRATVVGLEVALAGWDMGEKCASKRRSLDSYTLLSQSSTPMDFTPAA